MSSGILTNGVLNAHSKGMLRRLFVLGLVLLTLAASATAAPPRRIVSLSPGTTEMLFALGLGRFVVGDTVYCDYPPPARMVAKIGDVNTSYERVLALKPDLIVADGVANGRAVARLTQLHQPVLAVRPTSLASVEESLRQIGQRTGTARQAAFVIGQMEHKIRQAELLAAMDKRPRPRVLIVVQTRPLWTAGAGTFMDDLVRRAGGVNIGTAVRGYGTFSEETVLAHPPDVVLGDAGTAAAFRADPLLSHLAAVRQGRFASLPPDLTSRPGPRLADGLLLVAKSLHGR